MLFDKLPSEKAVIKYGKEVNVLLLISPLPNNYMDYYAIKEFELIGGKYIVYIGELGASDGGEGMYNYMINESSWKLLSRDLLLKTRDILFGGDVEKEIFLFENI